jgi:serine/threonine-protein kinase
MPDPILLNNRYQLEERLGTGGMSFVYRARDLMLERNVAIKILRENFSGDPDFRERFHQEAKAAANLTHPNIVTVHDFGLDANRLFIVMEFVPGMHLKAILQRRGRLQVQEAISLMVQACAGVGYAHRAGLVHCDIKPHNMLITPDRRLKVTDFGIARALASIQPEERSDIVWGSPQYFAPEQAAGGPPSPASDVYSLGVILYELLTGRLPFMSDSPTELARMHRDDPPPSARQIIPDISPALEQILFKVLSKEPSTRYRTADQFGRVLISFGGQKDLPDITEESEIGDTTRPSASPVEYTPPAPSTSAAPYPVSPPSKPRRIEAQETSTRIIDENPLDIDWMTIALGLLALIAVGGLIPFYLWIYFLFF